MIVVSAPSMRALTGVVPDRLAASVSPAKISCTCRDADLQTEKLGVEPVLGKQSGVARRPERQLRRAQT